jgi:hypothetical protein
VRKTPATYLHMAMILIVACTLCVPLSSYAQLTGTSNASAATIAHNWLQYNRLSSSNRNGNTVDAAPSVQEIFYQGQLVGYAASEADGYVIVPAYSELPPVIAFSTASNFNANDDGGFVELIKEELASKIQVAQTVLATQNPGPEMQPARAQIERDRAEWQAYSTPFEQFHRYMESVKATQPLDDTQDVGPLITTNWHQGTPYNNDCPMGTNGRCVVGCVATAMSQILAFWHSPASGTGSHSYTWSGDYSCGGHTGGGVLSADYSDPYDWANMPNAVYTSSPQAQQDAVAELCYEVGVSVNMNLSQNVI